MKFWIALFSLALFAGGASLGIALDRNVIVKPRAPEPEMHGSRHFFSPTRFVRELDLTPEQDAELDDILGDTQRDVEAYSRAIRSAHERSRERIETLLTKEQRARLDSLVEEERRRRSDQEIDRQTGVYTALLKLDETQAKAVREAVMETRRKKGEYFSQLRRGGDWHDLRGTFRDLREEQNRRIEAALRPEQFAQYMEIQKLMDRH